MTDWITLTSPALTARLPCHRAGRRSRLPTRTVRQDVLGLLGSIGRCPRRPWQATKLGAWASRRDRTPAPGYPTAHLLRCAFVVRVPARAAKLVTRAVARHVGHVRPLVMRAALTSLPPALCLVPGRRVLCPCPACDESGEMIDGLVQCCDGRVLSQSCPKCQRGVDTYPWYSMPSSGAPYSMIAMGCNPAEPR